MNGRTRIGLLGATLLALGAIPPLTPRRPDVDLDAAEKVMSDLQAAGLDPSAVVEHVGAERFVQWGRAVLGMQLAQRALGCEMTTPGLLDELDRFAQGRSIAQLGELCPEHLREPQIVDFQPMYDLGARKVTLGDEHGRPLAHITLREGARTQPVRGNPVQRPSPVQTIADMARVSLLEVRGGLQQAPVRLEKPRRDRTDKRAKQAKARAGKQRRKARRGF